MLWTQCIQKKLNAKTMARQNLFQDLVNCPRIPKGKLKIIIYLKFCVLLELVPIPTTASQAHTTRFASVLFCGITRREACAFAPGCKSLADPDRRVHNIISTTMAMNSYSTKNQIRKLRRKKMLRQRVPTFYILDGETRSR